MSMNINLMHKDTIIATTVKNSLGIPYKVVVLDGISKEYTPFDLFKMWTTREATMEEFINWASDRCFPPDRIGVEERLRRLGLTEYDGWEIVKRTGGHMSTDHFWIDFNPREIEKEEEDISLD